MLPVRCFSCNATLLLTPASDLRFCCARMYLGASDVQQEPFTNASFDGGDVTVKTISRAVREISTT